MLEHVFWYIGAITKFGTNVVLSKKFKTKMTLSGSLGQVEFLKLGLLGFICP